jgi:hypothetical protein
MSSAGQFATPKYVETPDPGLRPGLSSTVPAGLHANSRFSLRLFSPLGQSVADWSLRFLSGSHANSEAPEDERTGKGHIHPGLFVFVDK